MACEQMKLWYLSDMKHMSKFMKDEIVKTIQSDMYNTFQGSEYLVEFGDCCGPDACVDWYPTEAIIHVPNAADTELIPFRFRIRIEEVE